MAQGLILLTKNIIYLNKYLDLFWFNMLDLKAEEVPNFIKGQMRFLGMINLRQRKSSKSWAMRTTQLDLLLLNDCTDTLEQEIKFCEKCSQMEQRNYYNWYYR